MNGREDTMKNDTCCFAGHRKLPKDKIDGIVKTLNGTIESLIEQGVTNFISGGALGFDTIAASLIVAKKQMGEDIRLIMALPCKNQDERWDSRQREVYHNLLAQADEVVYVSELYYVGCMKKRNKYMVDQSNYCVCALLHERSGTGQTVRYAERKGATILNVMR